MNGFLNMTAGVALVAGPMFATQGNLVLGLCAWALAVVLLGRHLIKPIPEAASAANAPSGAPLPPRTAVVEAGRGKGGGN